MPWQQLIHVAGRRPGGIRSKAIPGTTDTATQYGGALFEKCSTLSGRIEATRGRAVRRITAFLLLIPSMRALWLSLPIEHFDVHPPLSVELRRRHWGMRWPMAMLPLDGRHATGKRRQAVRTNMNRAQRMGFKVRALGSLPERMSAIESVRALNPRSESWIYTLLDRPDDSWWGVFDEQGQCVGLATVSVIADVGILQALLGQRTDDALTGSRYLLHSTLASDLFDAGVRRLVVAGPSPVRLPDGLRYFQKITGYCVVRPQLS